MTRDEAIRIVRQWGLNENTVGMFIELGFLKLDEPKSLRDKFINAICEPHANFGRDDALIAYDKVHK